MLITLLYVYFIHRHNDWFVCHSDKVKIAGSTPALWTTKFIDTYSNSKAHYWL